MRVYQRKKGGTWWMSWTENGATQKRTTRCSSKPAALLVASAQERRLADPALAAASEATLGVEARLFLDRCQLRHERRLKLGRIKGTLSASSVKMFRQKVGVLLTVLGADAPLASIDATTFGEYVKTRMEPPYEAEESTVYKEWVALRGILKQAKHEGRYHLDISGVRPLYFSGQSKRVERRLSAEQIPRLLRELPKDRADVIRFVLATGARRGEWVNATRDGDYVHLPGTKTSRSDRRIPVPAVLAFLLEGVELPLRPWTHGNARRDILSACLRASVCPKHRDTPTGKRGPARYLRPVDGCEDCRACSLPHVTWNDLRRTYNSLLAEAGVVDEVRAKLMGHAGTTMVREKYTVMEPEAVEKLVSEQTARTNDQITVRVPRVSQNGASCVETVGRMETCQATKYG